MNKLRHIVLLLGIGVLFAQDPPEGFQFNQSTVQAFYYFETVTFGAYLHCTWLRPELFFLWCAPIAE